MLQVSFDPIIADAFRRAALAGCDMYVFAGQMERFKSGAGTETGLYQQWDRLDDLIGDTLWNAQDAQHLLLLRQVFFDFLGDIFSDSILQAGADAGADWARWRQAFSEASYHWRLEALQALCQAPALEKRFGAKLGPYRRFVFHFSDRRWVETHPVFEELADDPALPAEHRGHHNYVCGQIDLYFYYEYENAKQRFEKAKNLLSGNPLSLHGWIEYYLKGPEKEKDPDRALQLAEEALQMDNRHVSSIFQKADILMGKEQLAEAESLYRQARQIRPGNLLVYPRLMELFGQAALFEKRAAEIETLLKLDLQLDPGGNHLIWTDTGVIYQKQGKEYWPVAEQYQNKAIELYPQGIMAPLNLGYFYMDVAQDNDKAEPLFQQVLDQAPEAREGYLAMARLCEARQQWEAAIPHYAQVEKIIPSWQRFMLTAIGRCHRRLEHWDAAEEVLLRAWRLDTFEDSGALTELYDMAQQLYESEALPQPDRAVRLLEQAAQKPGIDPLTLSAIANRQANALFYVSRYSDALPYYQRATILFDSEPVYFTNLANCLDKLFRQTREESQFRQAIEALNKAALITPQDSSIAKKRRQMALVRHNPHLATLPVLYQVHVEVGQPLLKQITQDYQTLLPEINTLADALRQRLYDQYAINLPGLRYREIAEGDGAYQFRLYETPVVYDRLPETAGAEPQIADVVDRLEQFITNFCLDLFINYWDVDKEVPFLPNTELIHFTRVTMAMLAERTALPPLPQLHQLYRRLDGPRLPVARAVEKLRLLDELRSKLPGTQIEYSFARLGDKEEQMLGSCLLGQDDNRALAVPVEYARELLGAVIRFAQTKAGQQVALVTRQEELRPFLRSILAGLPQIPVLKDTELPDGAYLRNTEPLEILEADSAVFQDAIRQLHPNISPDAESPQP